MVRRWFVFFNTVDPDPVLRTEADADLTFKDADPVPRFKFKVINLKSSFFSKKIKCI